MNQENSPSIWMMLDKIHELDEATALACGGVSAATRLVLDRTHPSIGSRPNIIGKVEVLMIVAVKAYDIEAMCSRRSDFTQYVQAILTEVGKDFDVSDTWKESIQSALDRYYEQIVLLKPVRNPAVKIKHSLHLQLTHQTQPNGISGVRDPDSIQISLFGGKIIELKSIEPNLSFTISGIEGSFERIETGSDASFDPHTIVDSLPADRTAGNAYCAQLIGKELK